MKVCGNMAVSPVTMVNLSNQPLKGVLLLPGSPTAKIIIFNSGNHGNWALAHYKGAVRLLGCIRQVLPLLET